jgi:hypothetical protein
VAACFIVSAIALVAVAVWHREYGALLGSVLSGWLAYCCIVGLSEPEAVRTMLAIHRDGSTILPSSSLEESQRMADAITAEARASNHPLICRALNGGSSQASA